MVLFFAFQSYVKKNAKVYIDSIKYCKCKEDPLGILVLTLQVNFCLFILINASASHANRILKHLLCNLPVLS